jgi:hypothetical protein
MILSNIRICNAFLSIRLFAIPISGGKFEFPLSSVASLSNTEQYGVHTSNTAFPILQNYVQHGVIIKAKIPLRLSGVLVTLKQTSHRGSPYEYSFS